MVDAKTLLESIPKLLKAQDAAALVEHQDHADKKVRKAVRKALHALRSRGVEVPDAPSRSWSTGDVLQQMRGDLEPTAHVDTRSTPGALRFLISLPQDVEGARLFAGAIGPDDRVLDFNAYQQTDGQRTRLLRDWARQTKAREVSVPWVMQRIRWAREQTIASGYPVPRALDQALSSLGEAPSERPSTFLGAELQADAAVEPEKVDAVMVSLGVPLWPPMVNLDSMLEKAAEIHGDKPQPEKEEDRLALLAKSVEGDSVAREGLSGTLANALDDAAVHAWLEGENDDAQSAFAMAAQLRGADAPESLEFAPRLLGYQVASLLRAMGGPEAVARAQAQAAQQA